jgi:peptide/nickel transport system substrate-binding protein
MINDFQMPSLMMLTLIVLMLLVAACAEATQVSIPFTNEPQPTPTHTPIVPTEMPPPPKTLVICMAQEPSSLFIYGDTQSEADTILQAIYDGPMDVLSYQYEPVILTKLPSLEEGDARIEQVTVAEGETYLNPVTQLPDLLVDQKPYFPAGCHQSGCMETFSEGEVVMDRMVVEFEILPGVTWSDGEPVKASDSVYSFNVDADESIPTTKYLVQRTSSYTTLDDQRTQWMGIPGFMDPEFESNFWSPLPEHILGSIDNADLPEAEEASRFPIGWGPYVIESWESGVEIRMVKSETYFRAEEGLPHFDQLRFRFLGSEYISALEQTLTGECDILDESVLPSDQWGEALDLAEEDLLQVATTPGAVMERIDFNLSSGGLLGQFALLSDVRFREVIQACIDRQGLMRMATFGLSTVPDSYLPSTYPLHSVETNATSLTISEAMTQLDGMGWRDHDQDPTTPRIAQGISGVVNGTPLEFQLLTTDDAPHQAIVTRLQDDLAQCGIGVEVEFGGAEEIFTPWPNGPVFGGRFDMVAWGWPTFVSPPCEMFAGFEIPSADYVFGVNASGFTDTDYDEACRRIIAGPASGEDYLEAVQQTEEIFQSQIPSIPLFLHLRVIAYGVDVCGIEVDPTTYSVLWNLEEIDSGEECVQ